jgi:hypothetical protein
MTSTDMEVCHVPTVMLKQNRDEAFGNIFKHIFGQALQCTVE